VARFKKIYVEITNVCNLRCAFCPGSRRESAFMETEAFRKLAGGLRGYTRIICLHVMGEPLLHPGLADILEAAREQGLAVNLTTNGALLPRAQDILLSSPALRQLNVSLHSQASGGDVRASCGGQGKSPLDDYLGGIFSFCGAAAERESPLVSLRLWNNAGGRPNPDNAPILEAISERFRVRLPEDGDASAYAGIRLAPRIYLNRADAFSWPELESPDLGPSGFCHGLRDQIAILVDGRVTPCCLDAQGSMELGNAFTQDLAEILSGERARAIFDSFSNRLAIEPLCRRCSYKSRF
jgi:radical SAM protein with 4Fe4S-binding SPASM domain